MAIKTKSLRDRRPKTEPVEVETDKGNVVKFLSPLSKKARGGMEALELMTSAESREDVANIFKALAENGIEDMDTIIEDDDPTLGDLLEVIKAVSEEFEKQQGSSLDGYLEYRDMGLLHPTILLYRCSPSYSMKSLPNLHFQFSWHPAPDLD